MTKLYKHLLLSFNLTPKGVVIMHANGIIDKGNGNQMH